MCLIARYVHVSPLQPAECIMTCDLEEYLVQHTESESALSCECITFITHTKHHSQKTLWPIIIVTVIMFHAISVYAGVNLCLRKAAEATSTCLRFAVYIETTIASQVGFCGGNSGHHSKLCVWRMFSTGLKKSYLLYLISVSPLHLIVCCLKIIKAPLRITSRK